MFNPSLPSMPSTRIPASAFNLPVGAFDLPVRPFDPSTVIFRPSRLRAGSSDIRWQALFRDVLDAVPRRPSSPASDLRFGDPTQLRIALASDSHRCRQIAEGATFEVNGQQFKLKWHGDYEKVDLEHLSVARSDTRSERRLRNAVLAQLDTDALRDAMTFFIDRAALERGVIPADIRQRARNSRLIGVHGAPDWLRFTLDRHFLRASEWRAVDTRSKGCLYRLRAKLHSFHEKLRRFFCGNAVRDTRVNRDELLRLLTVNLSPAERDADRPSPAMPGAEAPERLFRLLAREWPMPWRPEGAALRMPVDGERDREAESAQARARRVVEGRWPGLRVRSPFAVQVLLWHPDLDLQRARELAAHWDTMLLPEGDEDAQHRVANAFTDLIARLGEAEEFRAAASRLSGGGPLTSGDREKIRRVQQVLHAVGEDSAIRQLCFALASEGLQRCGDRVALCFSTIEAECLVHAIDRNDGASDPDTRLANRIGLGRRMFNMAKFDELARPYLLKLAVSEDAVEHRLHLQKRCQEQGVAFPVPIGAIRYAADVPPSVVRTIATDIKNAQRDVGAVAGYLAQQGFWRRFVEQYRPTVFEAACADLDDDLNALGAHELRWSGMDDDLPPDVMQAMAKRDVAYFFGKYLAIGNPAEPPQPTMAQCKFIRSQIAAAKAERMQQACRALTEALLAENPQPAKG